MVFVLLDNYAQKIFRYSRRIKTFQLCYRLWLDISGIMKMAEIAENEEEILENAIKFKITFYNVSYVYLARAKQPKLI